MCVSQNKKKKKKKKKKHQKPKKMSSVLHWADPVAVPVARPRGASMRLQIDADRLPAAKQAQGVDFELWANHLFFVGSIAWCVDAFGCWLDEDNWPCSLAAFVASICFILNAIVVQLDWFFRGRFTLVARKRSLFSSNYRLVDWYFWSNIFFWGGAVGDQVTSVYYLWEDHFVETEQLPMDLPFITNNLACYFWTVSGMLGAMLWYCDRIDRIAYKTKTRFAMFGPRGRRPEGYTNLFDFRGWGDWCFWPGAVLYTISSHGCLPPLELYNSSILCNMLDVTASIAYILNSLMYYPDIFRRRAHPEYYELERAVSKDEVKQMLDEEQEELARQPPQTDSIIANIRRATLGSADGLARVSYA
jgi:hypothetical protein